MNKLVAFALALTVATCQMPLRSAEAVSHIYHCGKDALRGAWEKGYHNLIHRKGNPVSERDIKYNGKSLRYRNKKCRSVANIQMHGDAVVGRIPLPDHGRHGLGADPIVAGRQSHISRTA